MDKYEFNIKVEQIKKLVSKKDFETAMKIADTIDWRRVRNANLLSMVAQVYEKNEEYQEAKDILLMAFERAPIGKRLLFKLSELALKEGNIEEAEAYYREFCDLAPDDSRQHLLRYLILKAKFAPIEQLIHSLEGYTAEELDEKWLYELAELYNEAGDGDRCIRTCDKIMLMFGLGKYVERAMELKKQHAPLTRYQMDLVENRDKYEAKLRAVEQNFEAGLDEDMNGYEQDTYVPQAAESYPDIYPVADSVSQPASQNISEAEPDWAEDEVSEPLQIVEEELPPEPSRPLPVELMEPQMPLEDNHDYVMAVKEAEVEEHLAEQMSKITLSTYTGDDVLSEQTRVLGDLRSIKMAAAEAEYSEPVQAAPEGTGEDGPTMAELAAEPAIEPVTERTTGSAGASTAANGYLMIQARTPEKGLEMAVEALKELQTVTGIKNPVAKISGERLNSKGLLASAAKLKGKDLIIEEAGDLSTDMINELEALLRQGTGEMRIILLDNPKQMDMLTGNHPVLLEWFELTGESAPEGVGEPEPERPRVVAAHPNSSAPQVRPADKDKVRIRPVENGGQTSEARPVRHVQPEREEYQKPIQRPVNQPEPTVKEEEMDIDEFAQYACKYAAEIDCSITGKSMLALYERIEIMEEDGILLTKSSAEELIEEAADKAEKPSLGKLITGVFSSKYDKDGLLILKEEHFI